MQWQPFLLNFRIEHVEHGPNVARGNINIACPFCAADGTPDPSHHMGLDPETGFWGCWRNADHRGKSPLRLIKALLRVDDARAKELAKQYGSQRYTPDQIDQVGREHQTPAQLSAHLAFQEFRPISLAQTAAKYWNYLEGTRGWGRYTARAIREFNLRYSNVGPYRDRVIVPACDADGAQVVSFIGRAISPNATLRYKAPGIEEYAGDYKSTIFNLHRVKPQGGHTLVITEGAFDTMLADIVGQSKGIRFASLWNTEMTESQMYLLFDCADRFDRFVISFDAGAEMQALTIKKRLAPFVPDVEIVTHYPKGATDLGEVHQKVGLRKFEAFVVLTYSRGHDGYTDKKEDPGQRPWQRSFHT